MPNVSTFLDARASHTDTIALHESATGETYTSASLLDQVSRVAGGLDRLGVRKGDRVCLYLDSSPAYIISYLAIWRCGAVAVPVNIVYRDQELLHVLRDSGAVTVISDPAVIPVVERVRPQAPALMQVVTLGEAGHDTQAWSDLARGPWMRAVDCRFDDLCHIQYTAGTTGRPKGAMLSHGNWISALDAEREALALTQRDVYLGIYTMGHVGVSWGIAALRAGGIFIALTRFEMDSYLQICREHRVTVLSGMPPVLHSLVMSPHGTEEAFRTVRVVISGGGPLPPTVWEAFDARFHIPVVNAYGLSETIVVGSGTATIPGETDLTRGFRSVGIPIGYTEVTIVDPESPEQELPAGETGEIALRGPAVAQGYWHLPQETAEVFRPGGWFLTGDIGYRDEMGILFVTDRKKDMIIMSGWKIYPAEVENILLQHPAVQDAGVFAVPDDRRGEIPVAAVVAAPGQTIKPDEVISFCQNRLAGYKVPRKVILVDALPRIHGWKLMRRQLREKFGKPQQGSI